MTTTVADAAAEPGSLRRVTMPTPAQVYAEALHPGRVPAAIFSALQAPSGCYHAFIGPGCTDPGARSLPLSEALGLGHTLCVCPPDSLEDPAVAAFLATHGLGKMDGWMTTLVHVLAATRHTPLREPLDKGWLVNNARTVLDELHSRTAAAPITLGRLQEACLDVIDECLRHPEYDHDRLTELSWLPRTDRNLLPAHVDNDEWLQWNTVVTEFERANYVTTAASRQVWEDLKAHGTWVRAIARDEYPPGELYAISRHHHPALGRLLILPAFVAAQYPNKVHITEYFTGEQAALAGIDEDALNAIEAVRRLCRGNLENFDQLAAAYSAACD